MAAKDHGHHHRGAHGRGFPAGRGGIKPDDRHGHDSASAARNPQHAQERDDDAGDEGDPEAVNGEHVNKHVLF